MINVFITSDLPSCKKIPFTSNLMSIWLGCDDFFAVRWTYPPWPRFHASFTRSMSHSKSPKCFIKLYSMHDKSPVLTPVSTNTTTENVRNAICFI